MIPLIVRGVIIGEGIPKICVSLTSKTKAELLEDAEAILKMSTRSCIDLIEWRADHFEDLVDLGNLEDQTKFLDALVDLRRIIGDKPLIFTYRTANEGGAGTDAMTFVAYKTCLKTAMASGLIDLVDVELFIGDEIVTDLIAYAHVHNMKVIASNHDFAGTPELEELVARLKKMQEIGADILKIAVMPTSMKDVLTLLEATVIMSEQFADCPVVTVAMSEIGAISRVTGEVFGSAITFGQIDKMSAPGQITASELSEILIRFHNILPIENKL